MEKAFILTNGEIRQMEELRLADSVSFEVCLTCGKKFAATNRSPLEAYNAAHHIIHCRG